MSQRFHNHGRKRYRATSPTCHIPDAHVADYLARSAREHWSTIPQHKRTASNEILHLGVLERAAVAEAVLLANLG